MFGIYKIDQLLLLGLYHNFKIIVRHISMQQSEGFFSSDVHKSKVILIQARLNCIK